MIRCFVGALAGTLAARAIAALAIAKLDALEARAYLRAMGRNLSEVNELSKETRRALWGE